MKLGYLAVGHAGTVYQLTRTDASPRAQLLQKCGARSCKKMYIDDHDGVAHHVGYIVAGEWFNIYEVHSWNNTKG